MNNIVANKGKFCFQPANGIVEIFRPRALTPLILSCETRQTKHIA